MRYRVEVFCVDGSLISLVTDEPQHAYNFIHDNDHEGASIGVQLGSDGPWRYDEDAYNMFSHLPDPTQEVVTVNVICIGCSHETVATYSLQGGWLNYPHRGHMFVMDCDTCRK